MSTSPGGDVGQGAVLSQVWVPIALNAVRALFRAVFAVALFMWTCPVTVPGPGIVENVKPVTDVPGNNARDPLMAV
jgi:hypothetical protein